MRCRKRDYEASIKIKENKNENKKKGYAVIIKTDLYFDWSGISGRRNEENNKDHTILKPAKGVSNDCAA